MGRFLLDKLTLLNNEPRRLSVSLTMGSLSSSKGACCRRVMSEWIVRGSIEVISCPTTERKRSRSPLSLKYHPRVYCPTGLVHGELYWAPEDV
jgi:hypothetical protein